MATYLAFFAAGDFDIERGRAHGQRYYNAVSQRLGAVPARPTWRRSVAQSARITAWLEDELGDYPFATTGGLVTSLNPGFALENQSRPTYSRLPGPDDGRPRARPPVVRRLGLGRPVAGHLAQRGLRDLHGVPYAEAHRRAAHQPVAAPTYYDHYRGIRDRSGTPRSPARARRTIFASAIYDRGAMTLAALRNRIGNADFRRLLRRWVSVTTRAATPTRGVRGRWRSSVSGQRARRPSSTRGCATDVAAAEAPAFGL